VLEMLCPLVIYLLITQLINTITIRFTVLVFIFYMLIFSLSPIPMVRASWYDTSFFNVRLPPSVANTPKATVLVTYTAYVMDLDPRPQSYLIPFFPKAWRFIGIPFWREKYLSETSVTKQILTKLHDDKNKIYLLTANINMPALYQAAREFG